MRISPPGPEPRRLLREPLLHFLVLGAVLFVAHRLVVGDPRTIVVTPGIEASVARAFRDQTGRAPSAEELAQALRGWERDEALFRESLREKLDRDDPGVRTVLLNKVRAQAALAVVKREPTNEELDGWLAGHRNLYEAPVRYVLDWVPFDKGNAAAAEKREAFARSARAGADVRFLGQPIYNASFSADEVRERFGSALADALPKLGLGTWQPSEAPKDLLLVRVNRVEGGLPPPNELRPRLAVDWWAATQRQAVERALDAIASRYRVQREGR